MRSWNGVQGDPPSRVGLIVIGLLSIAVDTSLLRPFDKIFKTLTELSVVHEPAHEKQTLLRVGDLTEAPANVAQLERDEAFRFAWREAEATEAEGERRRPY